MIAVSDTSVLCYLTLLDCSDILHRRFETILIPTKVAEECLQAGARAKPHTFVRDQPEWLSIRGQDRIDTRIAQAHQVLVEARGRYPLRWAAAQALSITVSER